jgi:coenzyme F420 biosynthesis associated uncharacterized protein
LDGLIDWRLATRIAAAIGEPGADGGAQPLAGNDPFSPAAIAAACAEAAPRAAAYAGLEPETAPPVPEVVDRAAWSANALATLRELGGHLERRAAARLEAPGPLGTVARSVVGAALAAEAGAVSGYASRKVLGQYDVSLVDSERPPRLLFVAPNLRSVQGELRADGPTFVHWVALHETTHAIQFGSVPWLRAHLSALVGRLLDGAVDRVESGAMRSAAGSVLRSDPRGIASALLKGELARALAGPAQVALLDRIQATMAVIEGHAEHVMDAAVVDLGGGYRTMRDRLDERRATRSGIDAIVARMLGLDLKLRQYRLGKAFCDAVVDVAGIDGLNRVWSSPEALPDLGELERPRAWLERVALGSHA